MIEKRTPIPAAALERRQAIVGTTGSGKTYVGKGAVERKLKAKQKVVVIDPLDVWWGLRLMADGKTPSPYELVIFGGKHADLPITENGGKLLGEAIATAKESCIVSLGSLRTEAARRRFMVAFLDSLYEHTDPERSEPYTIVFDEADMWAPQKPFGGNAEQLLHLMEEIVRRGRVRGFLPWLISQRPAIMNKNVLSQVDGMIAMQLTGAHDRNAIGAWIEGHADPKETKELLASLASLQQGHGLLWVPRDCILKTMWFPENETFDSSRTPKRGEKKRDIKLKPLNLDRLKGQLASVEAEAKVNDPIALKKKLAELEAQLRKVATSTTATPAVTKVDLAAEFKRGVEAGRVEGRAAGFDEAIKGIHPVTKAVERMASTIKAIDQAHSAIGMVLDEYLEKQGLRIRELFNAPRPPSAPPRTVDTAARTPVPAAPRASTPSPAASGDGSLTSVMRETLGALAWWAAVGKPAPDHKQLAGMLGIVAGGSTMRSRLASLSAAGLITYPDKGHVSLTEAGAAAAPPPNVSATLIETLRSSLTNVERETFDAIPGPGEEISREDLAVALGKPGEPLQPNGSTIRSRLANLSTRDMIAYPRPGFVTRQDWVIG